MRWIMKWQRVAMTGILAAGLFLGGCATPQPVERTDPELKRKASAARAAFEAGDIRRASDLYQEALMRARTTGDAEDIGTHAYNVALCQVLLGRHERALEFLRQAHYEMDRAEMDMVPLRLVEAEVFLALQRDGEARWSAERAVEHARSPEHRTHARLLLALMELNAGNTDAARGEYRQARRHAREASLPVQARTEEVLARIGLAEGNHVEAAISYDRAAELYRRAGQYREMSRMWIRAGESYEATGKDAAAGYRYFRAARSLFGRNETVEALRIVERAVETAERAQDSRLAEEIALLFREISNAVKISGDATSN